jgi:DNA-binding response OmpR family regulator
MSKVGFAGGHQNLPSPIPVVCAAHSMNASGMEMGAAAYLVKPVLPTTLLKTLRQVMRRIDHQVFRFLQMKEARP